MAINKRSEDFTLEDIKQLIKENRELRLENSILKARTHSREWKGGGFTPNKKDNMPHTLKLKKNRKGSISRYRMF